MFFIIDVTTMATLLVLVNSFFKLILFLLRDNLYPFLFFSNIILNEKPFDLILSYTFSIVFGSYQVKYLLFLHTK